MLQLGDLTSEHPVARYVANGHPPAHQYFHSQVLQPSFSSTETFWIPIWSAANDRQRVGYMDIRDWLADVHLAFRYLSVLIEDQIVLPYSAGMRVCRG